MSENNPYPIGEPGQAWGELEKKQWFEQQTIKRSYRDDVVQALEHVNQICDVETYGELSYGTLSYPQFFIKSKNWSEQKANVLITGGVHGYETSGVHGALRFAQKHVQSYLDDFNFFIVPCVSPWAYETINRWNPDAVDPNRSFYNNSPALECSSVMSLVAKHLDSVLVHFDLHETTDTDATEFTPALAARDGKILKRDEVPDGFYLVGDSDNYCEKFHKAMIGSVQKITHIAPPDTKGNILDVKVDQPGVIEYEAKKLGLCMALSQPKYATTTEVYPGSPKVDAENCILAQVAAIQGGLDYLLSIN